MPERSGHVRILNGYDAHHVLIGLREELLRVRFCSCVHELIEGGENDLPEVEAARVHLAGVGQFLDEGVWEGIARLVVPRHDDQWLLLPNPIFQHLRRRFKEVSLHTHDGEQGKVDSGAQVMHHVTKLVEERLHLEKKVVFKLHTHTKKRRADVHKWR